MRPGMNTIVIELKGHQLAAKLAPDVFAMLKNMSKYEYEGEFRNHMFKLETWDNTHYTLLKDDMLCVDITFEYERKCDC